MTNIALIVAGGVGNRMGQEIPKQFITVNDKPIIIYTLEIFQNHPRIDAILVVCLKGWKEALWSYIRQYNLTKVQWIVDGGNFVQESIYNGVKKLGTVSSPDSVVVINDAIRPLVDEWIITDLIDKTIELGNAVTSLPYNEQIVVVTEKNSSSQYAPRENFRRVAAPQAYRLDKLLWAYEKAFNEKIGIHGTSYTNTLMIDLGEKIFFGAGSDRNLKITTKEDLYIFKAFLNSETKLLN